MKTSAYAWGLAMVAAPLGAMSIWFSGVPLWLQLALSAALLVYWYHWWRQQRQVIWYVPYPNCIALGRRHQPPLVVSTQRISYWGLCVVVGRHCLWRDQVTPEQWRYLRVLKRW